MQKVLRCLLAGCCLLLVALASRTLIRGPQTETPPPAAPAAQTAILPAPEAEREAPPACRPAPGAGPADAAVLPAGLLPRTPACRTSYRSRAWQAFPPEGRFG